MSTTPAAAMLGYSRDEIIGMNILGHRPRLSDADRLARVQGRDARGSARSRPSGRCGARTASCVPVEVNAKILPDGQWQGFVRDISERKAHEAEREALFERIDTERRRLQTVVDTLPLGVLLFEPGGAVTANRRTEELLGHEAHAGRRKRAVRRPHLPYPTARRCRASSSWPSRVDAGRDHHRRGIPGRGGPTASRMPILASAAPILDGQGRIRGGVAVFQDMSERMRLEQSVAANERLLKAVFDLLPVGIWIADKSGRIVGNNPAAERIWGGARYVPVAEFGEYKGWWVDTGKPHCGRGMVAGARRQQRRDLHRRAGAHPVLRRFVQDHHQLGGAAARRERRHHRRHRRERRHHRAARSAGKAARQRGAVPHRVRPAAGGPVDRRPRRRHHAGQPRRPAGSGRARATSDPSNTASSRAGGSRPESRSRPRNGASPGPSAGARPRARELIRIQCFDGSFKTVINWATPIRSDAGEITGAVAVNEDITALHQTQEQLRAAVRDREDILAVVTHDLRSPLSAIMTLAATVGAEGAAARRGRAGAGHGRRPGRDRAPDVGAGERPAGGGGRRAATASVLKITPTKRVRAAGEAAGAARPLFAREGIALRGPGDRRASGDPRRLGSHPARVRQSARQRAEVHRAPGEVMLRAEAQSASVRYCVANSGPALSPTELESMFQPFWQAGRGDLRGAGLGPVDLPLDRRGARRQHLGRAGGRQARADLLPAALRQRRPRVHASAPARLLTTRRSGQGGRVR